MDNYFDFLTLFQFSKEREEIGVKIAARAKPGSFASMN